MSLTRAMPQVRLAGFESTMLSGRIYLDHLAVGTERWSDGYPMLMRTLGGR